MTCYGRDEITCQRTDKDVLSVLRDRISSFVDNEGIGNDDMIPTLKAYEVQLENKLLVLRESIASQNGKIR